MSAMARPTLFASVLTAIVTSAFFSIPPLVHGQDSRQSLRNQYQGKTFVLRGFYSSDRLHYNASGAIIGDAVSGDWTSDGFVRVDAIHSSHHQLLIEGRRLLVIHLDGKEFEFLRPDKGESKSERRGLKIEVDFDAASASLEQGEGVLSKIFLTAQDNFADLVPDYWKPCVREAAAGAGQPRYFSDEFQSVPGVMVSDPNGNATNGETNGRPLVSCKNRTSRRGVTPRLISQSSPEFSDQARRAKIQGNVGLALVVNEQGVPENVHITRPLGYGLDEKALSCVQKWRFAAAEENGRPVAAPIAVEVNFHLY
jgi:TonB family protein